MTNSRSRRFRPLTLVALATGLTLTVAGCGSGGDSGSGDASDGAGKKLSVWIMEGTNPDAKPFFTEVSTAFQQRTGATLDVQYVPWASAHDQFTNAIAGGTTPDVAEIGTTWTPEFADAGALADLSSTVDKTGRDGFVPSLLEAGTYDQGVYGVPWYAGVRSFVYRKDMFDKAGVKPPKTWDELAAAGKKLKQADKDVIPLPISSSLFAYTPFVQGAGGQIATQNGDTWTSGLDSPEARRGTEFYTGLATKQGLSTPAASTWNEADVRDAFARGDAAMIITGSWTPASIMQANPDLKGKLGAFPIPGEKGGMAPSFVGGSHLGVFEKSQNQELASTFVEMMTTGEYAEKWAEQSGYFPGTNEALTKIEQADDPLVAPFAKQMKDAGATMPVTPKWGQVEGKKTISAMLQSVVGGKASVDDGTASAAREMNEIFGS